jgi:outer membrane immunogenic protein
MKTQAIKSALIGGTMLMLSAGTSAWAADLGPYHPYNPPPPEPVQSYEPAIWDGAYVGLNGGYGWANSSFGEPDGASGGGQIGYNWQRGRFVFGVEGDLQASDINGSEFGAFGNARTDIDWFSTVRGRLGIANGPLLIYGTGGVAFADIDNRVAFTGGPTLRSDDTQTGYAVGGGLEWAFAPHWTAKAEYLYLGFGDDTLTSGATSVRVNNDVQVARVGLNYKF